MGEWISLSDIAEGDIVRWHEIAYLAGRRKGRRPIKAGQRLMCGQVLPESDAKWIFLEVRGCSVVDETPGRSVPLIYDGEQIKRARSTIMNGEPQRYLWSDETARSLVVSRFLGISDEFRKAAAPGTTPRTSTPGNGRSRGRKPQPPRLKP